MGRDEQGLSAAGQATPPEADPTAVACQETGEVLQGAAGQIDTGRVDKHAKAPDGLVILIVDPSTRSFLHAHRRGHQSNLPSGWKRLLVGVLLVDETRGGSYLRVTHDVQGME
ncbi:hypothetical protein GCM10010358_80020 [Streptomyces minutiscleroticus]|uniref:Uncharacterized protein n=1 Tax=Streptomyces minutiscleroticus TaxID=68238 RepID=A0A918P372_9ACTN|nr:hypothetical protein [Streptomyces minutiscleroticus]GGY16284.1 hypothetical protein GCM10010358_80020 [Streptomyces minutiscleroticus]